MYKLIRMNLRRYLKSTIFIISAVLNTGLALELGLILRKDSTPHDIELFLLRSILVLILPVIWHTGRETKNGLFRNKIISGHSRANVFLSELISAVTVCTVQYFIQLAVIVCINSYMPGCIPFRDVMTVFINILLLYLFFTVVAATIGCIVPYRAVSVVAAVFLVLFMFEFSNEIETRLGAVEKIQIETESEYSGDSGLVSIVDNPKYVRGAERKRLEALKTLMPFNSAIFYYTFQWFGYESYEYSSYGEYAAEWKKSVESGEWDEYAEDYRSDIQINTAVLAAEIFFVTVLGCLIFRKKQFK